MQRLHQCLLHILSCIACQRRSADGFILPTDWIVIARQTQQQRTRRLGRRNGLIVGYGNADIVNPVFYAYDAQCPACYSGTGLIDRTLSIGNDGQATCSNCNRSYDLNNGGIISSGSQDGDNSSRLVRYRATTTGAYGVLTVSN